MRYASKFGAGERSRTALVPGWKPGAMPSRRHPLITIVKELATVAGIEPAGRGFGVRTSAIASRPYFSRTPNGVRTWGGRPESNRLTVGSQPAPEPFGFAHHIESTPDSHWSRSRGSNPHGAPYRGAVLPLELDRPGGRGANRTPSLADTNRAFSLLNFASDNWRLRPGSNRHVHAYETCVLPLALRSLNWRS